MHLEKEGQGNIVSNNASAYPHNISLDLLRKQIHSTLDINQPAQVELQDQHNSFAEHEDDFEVGSTSMEIRKRSMTNSKVNEHGSHSNLDLMLKLSPPGLRSNNLINDQKSSTPRTLLPPYLSFILSSDLGGSAKDDLPSLIVMGCALCYMYVMVSETDPKCPRCKNRMPVVDKFRVNCTKKIRKSRI